MEMSPGHGPQRVFLRRVAPEDEHEFTELARVSRDLHRPWIFAPTTAAEFRTYLDRFDGVAALGYVVCLRDSGVIAGLVNISNIMRGPYLRGTLGYGAFAPTAGMGYMREGVALAVGYGLGPLGLHRLEADIQPGNQASLHLVKRLGFRREGFSPDFIRIDGVWRDHERWAITTEMMQDDLRKIPTEPLNSYNLPT